MLGGRLRPAINGLQFTNTFSTQTVPGRRAERASHIPKSKFYRK
jgi:hypothetical protein